MSASQQYEDYWKLTLEYSDIYEERFNRCLNIIVNFIDDNKTVPYSPDKYAKLQEIVGSVFRKVDPASTRKSINQFVKLGFVETELTGYHDDTRSFLEEKNKDKKKSIFSKIVYSNSSLDSSVTTYSDKKEINFLIKTLNEVRTLDKADVLALMATDITTKPKGYLDKTELVTARRHIENIDLRARKYNQLGHFWSVLNNLDDLIRRGNNLYLSEDTDIIPDEETKTGRDDYLHRIYKNQLKEESHEKVGDVQCMVERLQYPSLIASHIKPFIQSNEDEAYDPNNGLLLSNNMDALFDKGYISFDNEGVIIISDRLPDDIQEHLTDFGLNDVFINPERQAYLEYHRAKIFR